MAPTVDRRVTKHPNRVASGRVERREIPERREIHEHREIHVRVDSATTTPFQLSLTTPAYRIHVSDDHVISIVSQGGDALHVDHGKKSLQVRFGPSTPRQPSFLEHARRRLQHGAERIGRIFGWISRVLRARRNGLLIGAASVAVVGLLITNSVKYMQQPTPPIIQALSNQYRSLDWLYADSPEQLLGLPAPLWPLHVQPPPILHKAVRQANILWHPDARVKHRHALTNALPPQADFDMIRKRLHRAKTQFYRRPPFYSDYSLVRPRMTIANDTLPKYQAGCVCSMHHALSSAAQHMVVPFWFWKTTLPTTTDDLAQYCPCSLAKAYDRLVRGLNSLPPAVEMYYGQAPLYVLLWKQPQASLKPQDQEKAIASQWLNDTRRVVQGRPKYLMFVSDDGDSINVPVRSAKQEKTRFLKGKNGVVYRRLYVDKEERAKVEAEAEAEENDEDEWNM